ncbi:synaptosomal-associated protein 29-like [Hippocampus comes]|uniref:synaptosomal-associated protein 29-like n=1 Tax=Hippocampus comes TaxID=109280 RepID=UPI00094F126C|nr:PREDICTED: synaptosomal-associated protein 29-like [Hippocampus comes]
MTCQINASDDSSSDGGVKFSITNVPNEVFFCFSRGHEDKYQASHPNLRKLQTEGFGATGSVDGGSSTQNGYPQNRHLRQAHQTLDNNLDEMADGLSRLKKLGLGLQSEIDSQNDLIDSLGNKVDKMDTKINNTNQQIKRLK